MEVIADGETVNSIPIIEEALIPQPLCNENFTIPGGSVKGFLKAVGNRAKDLSIHAVMRHMGILDLFTGETCKKPRVTIRGWDNSK